MHCRMLNKSGGIDGRPAHPCRFFCFAKIILSLSAELHIFCGIILLHEEKPSEDGITFIRYTT